MNCPHCNADSHVVDTRPVPAGIRRRRECDACKRRFTTIEITQEERERMRHAAQRARALARVASAARGLIVEMQQLGILEAEA